MIIPKKLILCLLLTLALFAAGTMIAEEAFAADWFNEDWHYRRQVTIDHTKVQDVADPSTTYANFPLLVFATGLSNINVNGTDIRFTASDGTTELPREIESFSGGTLYAWVKVTLTKDSSDSTDDVIYMYYGNPSATEPAPGSTYGSENVWDSNYKMVQHLEESPNDGGAGHLDSTSNGYNATPYNFQDGGGGTTNATGQINGADDFGGDDDYVRAGAQLGDLISNSDGTMTAWIEPTGTPDSNLNWRLPMIVGDYVSYLGITIGIATDQGSVDRIWFFNYDGNEDVISTTYNNDEPTHVALVHTGGTLYGYKNGVQIGSTPSGNTEAMQYAVMIGSYNQATFFNGTIDDVRVSNIARPAEWIETSYNNQNAPSSFLTISEQVSIPTMTEWGMIIFMVLAGFGSIYYLRRKRIES